MSDPLTQPSLRIEAQNQGLGEISQEQIEARALQLAHSDGRTTVQAVDRDQATAELLGTTREAPAPEAVEPQLEQVVAWDEPVDSAGQRVERGGLDDESITPQQLIEEGMAEADHDRRVAAAESPEVLDELEDEGDEEEDELAEDEDESAEDDEELTEDDEELGDEELADAEEEEALFEDEEEDAPLDDEEFAEDEEDEALEEDEDETEEDESI